MRAGREVDARSSGVRPAVRSQTDLRLVFFDRQQDGNLVCCAVQRLENASQETAGGLPVAVRYDNQIAPFTSSKNGNTVDT